MLFEYMSMDVIIIIIIINKSIVSTGILWRKKNKYSSKINKKLIIEIVDFRLWTRTKYNKFMEI